MHNYGKNKIADIKCANSSRHLLHASRTWTYWVPILSENARASANATISDETHF